MQFTILKKTRILKNITIIDVLFHADAWNDYQYFQENDIRILEKINKIIRDISRSSFSGIGKPEPLKHSLSGFWSRRIDQEHRLVYTIKNNTMYSQFRRSW